MLLYPLYNTLKEKNRLRNKKKIGAGLLKLVVKIWYIASKLVKNKLVNNKLLKNKLVKNKLVKNKLVKNKLVKNWSVKNYNQ